MVIHDTGCSYWDQVSLNNPYPNPLCYRVGLSAGTGLGVSSALVTNSGNEAPQPANQQQPNNAGAEAANQQQDNNNDHPEPANQHQDNNDDPEPANQNAVDNFDPEEDLGYNEENGEVNPGVIETIEKAAVAGAHCSKVSSEDDSQPSCSSATPETVLPEDKKDATKDKDIEKDIGNQDEAAMEYDIVTIATDSSKCSHCGGAVPSGNCDDEKEPSSKGKGKGKGKSLRGKKKGIAKQSNINNSKQVHQSCQAIGEEIREASKKAKENEELNKDNQSQPRTVIAQSESRTQNGEQSKERRQLRSDSQSKVGLHNGKSCKFEENGAGKKKNVPTAHKCTSTSDPVIEDDFIPVSSH